MPALGSVYMAMKGREHRRVIMPRTRHHVYYRVVAPDVVRLVSIWAATRGRGPQLR